MSSIAAPDSRLRFAKSLVVDASDASSSSKRSRGDFGGAESPATLKRGDNGEPEGFESLAALRIGGETGLLGFA